MYRFFFFLNKLYESISYTINGFSFKIKDSPKELKTTLNPIDDFINLESGIEEIDSPEDNNFLTVTEIKKKISELNAVPTKNFINEGYFL